MGIILLVVSVTIFTGREENLNVFGFPVTYPLARYVIGAVVGVVNSFDSNKC